MANIRIKDLPADSAPKADDKVPIDLGTTRNTTVEEFVFAGRPTATKTEAETGTDPKKAMTPLAVKQAIDAQTGMRYVPVTRRVDSGTGLSGGQELTGDVTLSLNSASIASLAKADSAVQSVNGKSGNSVTITPADVGAAPSSIVADVNANTAERHSHTNKAILDATTASFLAVEKTKLSGVATGATSNQTDAYLLSRANHTGVQAISTVTGLQAGLDAKANAAITITAGAGLTGGGTLAANRTIALSSTSIASLALADTSVQPARTIAAGAGLTGGGDLSANRTVSLNAASIASIAKADTAVQPGSLATVATSGAYNDLTGRPTLGAMAAKNNVAISDIAATGTANNGSFLRGDGTWSPVAGAGTVTSVAMTVPTGLSVTGSPITGAGTLAVSYATGYQGYTSAEATKLGGIAAGAQVNTVTSVAGKTGAVTLVKADVGLGNVDNTSDANKPIGTATQTALNTKASYNWIINGDFTINQRGGVKKPANGVYGFDRWKGHASGIEQIVEALPAGEYTLTWTGGGNGTFGGVTSVSPIKATVASGNTSIVVPQTSTKVSLVRGDATAQDPWSPRLVGEELTLCMRYFQTFGGGAKYEVIGTAAHDSATSGRADLKLLMPMRAAPSFSSTAASTFALVPSFSALTSISADMTTHKSILLALGFPTIGGGVTTQHLTTNNTLAARLNLDAEM